MEQVQRTSQHLPSITNRQIPQSWTPQATTPPLSLPHLSSAATKAERYVSLTEFDRKGLQRPKAHFRNALKTTENIDRIAKHLDQHLIHVRGESKNKVSFDRLSAHRDAFEEIIKTSGAFAPLLQDIKDMYNQYLMGVVSKQAEPRQKSSPLQTSMASAAKEESGKDVSSSEYLLRLKKQLHQLEVESRVLIHENNRLREELVKEKDIYLKRKQHETADLHVVQPAVSSPKSLAISSDYATQVENLQIQIAEERLAISKITSKRKGRIPLSVCHNLEQCLREVEIETQKCQRCNEHLTQEIKKWQEELLDQLKTKGCSDHYRGIWDKIITAQ